MHNLLSDPLNELPNNHLPRNGRRAVDLVDRVAAFDAGVERWKEVKEARRWLARAKEVEAEAGRLGSPDLVRQLAASSAIEFATGSIDVAEVLRRGAQCATIIPPEAKAIVAGAVTHCDQMAWAALARPRDRWITDVLRPCFAAAAEPLGLLARRIPADWVDGLSGSTVQGNSRAGLALDENAARLRRVLGELDELWVLADEMRSCRLVAVGPPCSAHEFRWRDPQLAPIRPAAPGWALLTGWRAGAVPTIKTQSEASAALEPLDVA